MTKFISDPHSDYSSWRRVENPKGLPEEDLPYIYVLINGWMGGPVGVAVSADGMGLGSHACSAEGYIYYDLGIAPGSRPDRHETYLKHYPDGYILQYVPDFEIEGNAALQETFKLAKAAYDKEQKEKTDAA